MARDPFALSVPYDVSALEIEHLTGGASQNLLVVQDEPGRSLEWKTVRTIAFAVATPNCFPLKRRESRRYLYPLGAPQHPLRPLGQL